jgi:hypothetical protein
LNDRFCEGQILPGSKQHVDVMFVII